MLIGRYRKVCICLLLITIITPLCSIAQGIGDESYAKVYIGELSGKKIYNCYGADKSIIIDNGINEVILHKYEVIDIAKEQILAIHYPYSYVNNFKVVILDDSGSVLNKGKKINETNSNSYLIIDNKLILSNNIMIHKENDKWILKKENFCIFNYNIKDLLRKRRPELFNRYTYIAESIGNKVYCFIERQMTEINGYDTYFGKLSEFIYTPGSSTPHRSYTLTPLVYNVHADNDNLYFQKYRDNSLYDIKINLILKDIDGIAIVKDGFILYKNGETLKLATVEAPNTTLREAIVDYTMVKYEHALNEDIVHVKKDDSITFKTYSSILKEFSSIDELFTKDEDNLVTPFSLESK